jgi:hypothetical protein
MTTTEERRQEAARIVAAELLDLGYITRADVLALLEQRTPVYPHRSAPFELIIRDIAGLDMTAASYFGFRADILAQMFPKEVERIVGEAVVIDGTEVVSIMTGHRRHLDAKPKKAVAELAARRAIEDYALAGEEKGADNAAVDTYARVCRAGGIPGPIADTTVSGFAVDHLIDYLRDRRGARTAEDIRQELADRWLAEDIAGGIADAEDRRVFLEEFERVRKHPALRPTVYAAVLGAEVIVGDVIAYTDEHGRYRILDTATGQLTTHHTATGRRSVHQAAAARAREDYALALAAQQHGDANKIAVRTYQQISARGSVPAAAH